MYIVTYRTYTYTLSQDEELLKCYTTCYNGLSIVKPKTTPLKHAKLR